MVLTLLTVFDEGDIHENGYIHLAPRTHDISFTENHISGIEELGEILNIAAQAACTKRSHIRYTNVHALLISWEDDDLQVVTEIKDLQHVLQDKYYFDVELYKIPSTKPGIEVSRRLLQFLDLDGDDTLLILYYGGHAKRGQLPSDPSCKSNIRPTTPSTDTNCMLV